MNIRKLSGLKALGAAVGASLALASAPAAAISWYFPDTSFEDDNLDFLYEIDGGNLVPKGQSPAGTCGPVAARCLEEGNVLVAVLEIGRTFDPNGTAEDILAPDEELTGVAGIQIADIDPTPGGFSNMLFKPVDTGLNSVLGLGTGGVTVTGGNAGGGAMVALFLDNTLDITVNPPDCTSISDCIDGAIGSNPDLPFQVDGYGDGDFDGNDPTTWTTTDRWAAIGVATNADVVAGATASEKLGNYNFALTILDHNTGQTFQDSLPCPVVLQGLENTEPGWGCDGPLNGNPTEIYALTGSGDVLGGSGLPDSLFDDGVFARSDFDATKNLRVPEPNVLALLAAGFISVGVMRRRRNRNRV